MKSPRNSRRFAQVGAVFLTATSLVPLSSAVVQAAAGDEIDGFVFSDTNHNGVKEASEPGLGGVTVTFIATDGTTASTTTAADGSYVGTGLSGRYRIEFSGAPVGMYPSRHGSDNGTTVQFADAGATVKVGYASPDDFCQSNPEIAITCFTQNFGPLAATNSSLRTLPYGAFGTAPSGVADPVLQTATGSTYGLAYHRASSKVFQAAFYKRAVDLGPSGLGAIYATPKTGGTTSVLATIPNTGGDPRTTPVDWTIDAQSFSSIYKIGLGDIDLSADQKTMFVVNLNDNGIYSIAMNPDGTANGSPVGPLVPATPATCSASQFHVFGLGINKAKGYLGGVCAGPTQADLKGYVFEFGASSTAASMSAAPTLTFPLTVKRGQILGWGASTNEAEDGKWLAWGQVTGETDSDVRAIAGNASEPIAISAPQPQISDLVVSDQGDLIISMRDRFGDQVGWGLRANTGGAQKYEGASGGDILLACGAPGAWTLESNGKCGTRTGSGVGNNEGPGGGEFFGGDNFNTGHLETSLGSLLRVPGKSEVVASVYDPFEIWEQGLFHMSTSNGAASNGVRIRKAENFTSGNIGKANGLGDLEALCDAAPIEIGNRIWVDRDGDGVQDPRDPGLGGVTVELWKGDVQVGTTTTAADGTYYFNETNVTMNGATGIVPNTADYQIRIPNASGASQQTPLAKGILTTNDVSGTGNDVRDSDASLVATTAVIAVPAASIAVPGQNDHTFDAGFTPVYSLGNRVWLDSGVGGGAANNGIQDGTEPGIASVKVKLFAADASGAATGTALAMQDTDANGFYRFDSLAPGNYVVVVDTVASSNLDGLSSSTGAANPETVATDKDDNGNDTLLGAGSVLAGGVASNVIKLGTDGLDEPTGETDLPSGGTADSAANAFSNQTIDFGFVPTYSVGNRVWFDTNNDGVFQATETPAANVSMTLLDSAGNPVAGKTMNTDANGFYRFDGLNAGDYSVRVNASNFAAGGVLRDYASSTTTEADPDSDVDRNDNGLQPTTPNGALTDGIKSAPITLGGVTAEPTAEADNSGTTGDSIDSRSNLTVDFGFYKTVVGNTVWFDADNDGEIDATEARLQGVTVNLVDATTAVVIGTATTDINGQYQISSTTNGAPLPVGTSVKIQIPSAQTALNGLEPSDLTGLADSFNHGTLVGSNVESAAFTLTPGATTGGQTVNGPTATTTNPTLDFGFNSPLSALGDRVWNDLNKNGQQDPGEPGVPGVKVELRDSEGAVIATKTTDENGLYKFIDLSAGTYSVRFDPTTLPTDAGFTVVNTGPDASDSDADTTTGITGTYVLGKRQYIPTVDAGIVVPTYSLGNRVWFDTNNDGQLSATEVPVSGVSVTLLDASGTPIAGKTAITDANGHYRFDGLLTGTYSVRIDASNFATGGALDGYQSSTPTATDPNNNIDSDDNGLQATPAVVLVSGIVSGPITLSGPNEPAGETDKSTAPGEAEDNRSNLTVDFGFYKTAVGNTVWYDSNDDGLVSANEPRIGGVVVELRDAQGAVIGGATTNSNGEYLIDRTLAGAPLPTGVALKIVIPAGQDQLDGLDPSTPVLTDDQSNHGTRQPAGDVTSAEFTLTTGVTTGGQLVDNAKGLTSNPTLDFGFNAPLGSLGDRVWEDLNKDGKQDPDEPGIAGVKVQLLDSTGAVFAVTQTDANGFYRFAALVPGDYAVKFDLTTLPAGSTVTKQDATAEGSDSDADEKTGLTRYYTVGKRQFVPTVDAGIIVNRPPSEPAVTVAVSVPVATVPPTTAAAPTSAPVTPVPTTAPAAPETGRLKSVVWVDSNENGVLDPTEPTLAGVEVKITGPNGFVKVVTTDAQGRYELDGLAPGEYTVEITGNGVPPQFQLISGKKVTLSVLAGQTTTPEAPFRLIAVVTELPFTGSENQNLARIALLLVAAGLATIGFGRRRESN
jgi:protocatechuate 3,4-dioxygenase beta subunit